MYIKVEIYTFGFLFDNSYMIIFHYFFSWGPLNNSLSVMPPHHFCCCLFPLCTLISNVIIKTTKKGESYWSVLKSKEFFKKSRFWVYYSNFFHIWVLLSIKACFIVRMVNIMNSYKQTMICEKVSSYALY